jgi:hypothetical protein
MNGLEKKFQERNKKLAYSVDITEYDSNAQSLLGWPGYRTAGNKSGLGYIETQTEWAHMQGVMFYRMMNGKFKTRHPVYFFCIALYALFAVSPIFLIFSMDGRVVLIHNLQAFLPFIVIGTLLLINMALSLIGCEKGESITGD